MANFKVSTYERQLLVHRATLKRNEDHVAQLIETINLTRAELAFRQIQISYANNNAIDSFDAQDFLSEIKEDFISSFISDPWP